MANNVTWNNNDGLLVRFGEDQGVRGVHTGSTQSNSKEQELTFRVVLTGAAGTRYPDDLNNDGTVDGFSGLNGFLPAGVVPTKWVVNTIVAPAGGTSYAIGTYQANGTAIDADGIRTDAGADGAQIGTTLAANSYVTVNTTGTYTAGTLEITVQYFTV